MWRQASHHPARAHTLRHPLGPEGLQQRPGFLEIGRVKTFREPPVDWVKQHVGSARLPWCCHSRPRLMAARSSQAFACWRWAMLRACSKQAVASAALRWLASTPSPWSSSSPFSR